ncbi:serine/threonine protein phosphatase [Flavobacterium columnare NBRC 100251 = ATCC 23463]|uniref:Metallophosphoesterase n=2 Tax=Flavobacterium columnare TaxID=996 RepID=G8X7T7_FLACA|nr:metallophosphoesterase family protein [Flavobacterium columnare]AEW86420.1 metallophosphoesterase [Flavobacterium columnare ATCC 49512]AMO20348.1 serine/threonine protein phosphatase [Flavobacterium columnare]ANO49602.1 metallophosphoesterase [Flavobacterium columnare]APT22457.1 serine/threonine protein phosphatase [Flavobacterium columnare]MBF6653653.1 serine/threonine protein phosphatase [Flavobacterium columnare]
MAVYIIGDIHGAYKGLLQVIRLTPLKLGDTLIFLGDYVDGWSESPLVLDFLIDLKKYYNCIYIRGNHDELLLDWLKNQNENLLWYNSGGRSTIEAYENISIEIRNKHIHFLSSLKDYYLDNKNRLFVHAGFTNLKGVEYEYYPRLLYWDRTLWEMALCLDPDISSESAFFPKRLQVYKEIFIGHTPVTNLDITTPLKKANVWNLDTGAAFKGCITILNLEKKEFWQSDPIYTLYPNEKGRN